MCQVACRYAWKSHGTYDSIFIIFLTRRDKRGLLPTAYTRDRSRVFHKKTNSFTKICQLQCTFKLIKLHQPYVRIYFKLHKSLPGNYDKYEIKRILTQNSRKSVKNGEINHPHFFDWSISRLTWLGHAHLNAVIITKVIKAFCFQKGC